ncbi:MAG: hypothetical protein WEC14_06585 [Chloroflexota bacterium]
MTIAGGPPQPLIRVDPALAEPAVWGVLTRTAGSGEARMAAHGRRADPIYDARDPASRDTAFARLALAEFTELALADPLLQAIAERPLLADRVRVVLIADARGHRDEGVTCEAGSEHLGFRIDASRFADADRLLEWARHALGHAEDTLDATFGFQRGWDAGGAGSTVPAATQARLHRLWDVSVDARLEAAGRSAGRLVRERHRARIAADLSGAGDAAIDVVVERLWAGPRPTFPALLDWAARPATLVAETAPAGAGRLRPDRCPLCRFPSDDVDVPDPAIGDLAAAEYPSWRPDHGLCARCADRYRFAARLGGAT